jgi:hypothetical protein
MLCDANLCTAAAYAIRAIIQSDALLRSVIGNHGHGTFSVMSQRVVISLQSTIFKDLFMILCEACDP